MSTFKGGENETFFFRKQQIVDTNYSKQKGNKMAGGSNLQVVGRRSRVAGHCFTNTESILNILKS